MLGWEVFVFRQGEEALSHPGRKPLASWQTGFRGLAWLDFLVEQQRAVDLGGNGYPMRFSIAAKVLFPLLASGPPANDSPPVLGDDYFLPEGWNSAMKLDLRRVAEIPPDEQLIVEAWDQS